MELQLFIERAIEQTETRQAKEASRAAELAKRREAWQSAITAATAARLEEIAGCYPDPLRPYIKADERFWPPEWEFEKWDEAWRPDRFWIEAPGLAPIFFSVRPREDGGFQNGGYEVWDEWSERALGDFCDCMEAVATAAKIFRAQVERDEADRKRWEERIGKGEESVYNLPNSQW